MTRKEKHEGGLTALMTNADHPADKGRDEKKRALLRRLKAAARMEWLFDDRVLHLLRTVEHEHRPDIRLVSVIPMHRARSGGAKLTGDITPDLGGET